ncbi:MAG: hypothetical protein Q9222_004588 [Ikaeria aurantiellina]
MHLLNSLSVFVLLVTQSLLATCAPTPVEHVAISDIEARGSHYPCTSGRLFNIDGVTKYFAGTNTWWLGHLFSNDDVNAALSEIAATGYKVTRVWGFGNTNDPSKTPDVYYQVLNSSGQYINYNPQNGIARLDYAISAAQKYGVKLILPLLNNFDDLGGINTYTNIYGGTHQGFYTNAAAQAAYKNYIKFIVNRYKSSSAIFSWELCNEPRCSGCDPSVITKWATDISAYIKSLDRNHMVSLGDEGWLTSTSTNTISNYEQSYGYTGYEGVDFQKNLAIKTIDFGTFHMYPDQWGYNFTWGNTWITQHNAIGRALNKPVLMEEFAVAQGQDRVSIMGAWQDTVLTKTSVAGDMMWQFGTQFPSGINPFDYYAMYWNTSEFKVLGDQHAKAMTAKKTKPLL